MATNTLRRVLWMAGGLALSLLALAALSQPSPLRPARIAARPGSIIGRAVLENGQPVPKFHVEASGFTGKFNPVFGGNMFAKTDGANGRYAVHAEDATIVSIKAVAQFRFDNQNFGLDLWPTDNLQDGTAPGDYRGHTTSGIVRDFVLKLEGLRPGFNAAQCPDHEGNVFSPKSGSAYYGGKLYFDCGSTATADFRNLPQTYPAGSIVTVTLTPTSARVDGLPARTITRTCPLDVNFTLYGIPYALYSASASITEPSGAVHPLKLLETLPPEHFANSPFVDPWHTSAPVRWKPIQDATNAAIIPVTLWLGP